jgi:hypothetical protein
MHPRVPAVLQSLLPCPVCRQEVLVSAHGVAPHAGATGPCSGAGMSLAQVRARTPPRRRRPARSVKASTVTGVLMELSALISDGTPYGDLIGMLAGLSREVIEETLLAAVAAAQDTPITSMRRAAYEVAASSRRSAARRTADQANGS